ncbi:MAG: RluA family pseudouridine synthase [Candidatus Krumholzibacteriia bacterium]
MAEQPLQLVVDEAEANLRLDAFLVARCPDRSRSRIQADLAAGLVTVDGRARPKNHRLRAGSEVAYRPAAPRELTASPQDIPLSVVWEDEHLAVIDKPAGLVVHPSPGHREGTLVNALLHRFGRVQAGSDPLRPGIVHRLDRQTSGLLVVALDERAHRRLQQQLRDRRMGRTYLTLAWGRWAAAEGTLTGDIGRHPRRRQQMAVVERGGRPAVSHYRVLEDFTFCQWCEVQLETGRTHQIRVHFAQGGHPVVGDPVYGDDKRARGVHALDRALADRVVRLARRQLLHAAGLRLEHPVTGRQMEFVSPLPADLAAVLAVLRGAGG